jgi:hypothetical protein
MRQITPDAGQVLAELQDRKADEIKNAAGPLHGDFDILTDYQARILKAGIRPSAWASDPQTKPSGAAPAFPTCLA